MKLKWNESKKLSKWEIILKIAMPKFSNQEKDKDLCSNSVYLIPYRNRKKIKKNVFIVF